MNKEVTIMTNVFLLQFLNNIYLDSVGTCLVLSELSSYKSLRLVLLQEEAHKRELRDFAETILSIIHRLPLTIQADETFLGYDDTKTTGFNINDAHLVVVWNIDILQQFMEYDHMVLVSKLRDFYRFFIVTEVSVQKSVSEWLWKKFGILNMCWCGGTTQHFYNPFFKNSDGTWGTFTNSVVKLKNLNQYPLRISMFQRDPTAITELPKLLQVNPSYKNFYNSTQLVGGLDGCILYTLAEYLNFTVYFVDGIGKENFGWVYRNGTAIGTLNTIVTKQAHINFNGRFLMDYKTKEIEFTVPFDADSLCAVVPKAEKIPLWRTTFNCFNKFVWLAIYLICLFYIIVWYLIQPHRSILRVSWEIAAIFHGIPVRIVPTERQAFFLLWALIFNIIFQSLVQGSFYKTFTTPFHYKDISTLEELDKANFPIATNFFSFDCNSKLISNLRKKAIKSGPHLFEVVAYEKNLAKLERKKDVFKFITTHYLDEDGTPLLHIVDECLSTAFISYIVPRGSPFLDTFNSVILKLFESGLTLKWYDDVEYSQNLEQLISLSQNKKLWTPFSVENLQAAFYILTFGESMATVALLGEIIIKNYIWTHG